MTAMAAKLKSGSAFPTLDLPLAGGGTVRLGGAGRWQVIVVYRGRHCPICKTYLKTLEGLRPGFAGAGAEIVAVSADPREKADADKAELGVGFPVAYGLTPDQMRGLGLYISTPRSPEETDRPFAEPALFLVNPKGETQIVDISNAPFARPDLASILSGLKLIRKRDYPIRGTAD